MALQTVAESRIHTEPSVPTLQFLLAGKKAQVPPANPGRFRWGNACGWWWR